MPPWRLLCLLQLQLMVILSDGCGGRRQPCLGRLLQAAGRTRSVINVCYGKCGQHPSLALST